MGAKKCLHKYYTVDFDGPKLSMVLKKPKDQKVQMMLPMKIRCNNCGNSMGAGAKLSCRKQNMAGECYLGIAKFRFLCRCTKCFAQFSLKTDPSNSDYTVESGATRDSEPRRVRGAGASTRRQPEEIPGKVLSDDVSVSQIRSDFDSLSIVN